MDREQLARETLGLLMGQGVAVQVDLWKICLARGVRNGWEPKRLARIYLLSLAAQVCPR